MRLFGGKAALEFNALSRAQFLRRLVGINNNEECKEDSVMNLKKLIAPTDLSRLSRAGVRYAVEMGREQGCEVIVYHIISAAEDWFADDKLNPTSALVPQQKQRLSEFVKETCADLLGKVEVRQIVELGVPYKKIVEKAKEEAADLIVISTHGRTGIDHMLVGSVTEKVVARASCPVLSIRPTESQN
jgi:universal stress protein A